MNHPSNHSFHIPVMGLAYTIDSPVKVARFGISSVISIIEDRLVEMMRKHYYPAIGRAYFPISSQVKDFRAERITDYLNLVDTIVSDQVETLRNEVFETDSDIDKYFRMLPDESFLKELYLKMLATSSQTEKTALAKYLRKQICAGSIDVNIMSKADRNTYNKKGELIEDGSDAVSALRGYANSKLENSSVVFSAGLNPRLYNYLENCKAFDIKEDGGFEKKVIVKVSDYRSAFIQGKYLAKKGIWVSEYRVESGLNCGGHAFATEGYLLGPVLEEFRVRRQELTDAVFEIYRAALLKKQALMISNPPEIRFSAQGGIGTREEDLFLHGQYNLESTGWGTPFLLVPEATTVDDDTLKLLSSAKESDLVLSNNSPLGVRFHYLKGTSADKEKSARIISGSPGSPCTEKHLAFNTEFTREPVCTASKKYQGLKLLQLKTLHLPEAEFNRQVNEVLDKECLCVGLSNSAAIKYQETFIKRRSAVNICPGPNIAYFSKVVSLETMVNHIYGRGDLLANTCRPHMFITELYLYIDFLKEQLQQDSHTENFSKKKKYYASYYHNLREGIAYYHALTGISNGNREVFEKNLRDIGTELDFLSYQYEISDNFCLSAC